MQRVRGVIADSSCDTSIRYVSGSMSTNRGVAAGRHDRRHRGNRGIGGGDDFVARPDVERAERQHQGVGAAVDADPVASAAVGRKLLFERANAVAEDQPPGPHDLIDRRQDVVALGLVLRAVIPDRNGHEWRDRRIPDWDMQRLRTAPIMEAWPSRRHSSPRDARCSSGPAASGSSCRPCGSYYPTEFDRYVEPFVGSGAVFFDLHAAGRLEGRRARLCGRQPRS